METAPYGEILYLAQIAVDVVQEIAELLGLLFNPEVPVQLGVAQRLPYAHPDRRELRRIQRLDLVVLVEELFEAGEIVVSLRPRHRWDKMVHHRRGRAPLCLCTLRSEEH